MIRRLLCAVAALFCLAQAPGAEESDLALQAQAAFTAGQVEMARMLALAVLNDDPRNATALAVLSAVGLATQEPEAARVVARQSYQAATDKRGKFTAARLAARASVDLDQPERAKYWLRRAVQSAPTAEAKAATVTDFLAVRGQSRWRVDLAFSVKPSDNVNQGAETRLLTIDGLPTFFLFNPGTMALSGVEAKANVGLRYRIAGTASAPTEIGVQLYHREVWLSGKAQAVAPDAVGSDYANSALDVFVLHRSALTPDLALSAGLTIGKAWLAGKPYSDRAKIDLTAMKALGQNTQSRLGFSIERQWLASGGPAALAMTLDAGLQHRFAKGDVIAVKLELGNTVSDDANQEHRKFGASLRYAPGKMIAGARVSATLGVTARDFPVFFGGIFNDSGREDLSVSASFDVAFSELGLFGFEPVLSLEASRTDSNISRYTGQAFGIGLRIQSSF